MRLEVFSKQKNTVCLRDAVLQTRNGAPRALEIIMRTHNQRLFRISRSILRSDAEAEDVVQETFIKAFSSASDLEDNSALSAWLGKIAINLSRDRLRRQGSHARVFAPANDSETIPLDRIHQRDADKISSPERQAAMGEVRRLIESEVDILPEGFREVFVLRIVEQMSVSETASVLDIPEATIKTRLHRAKALLRAGLSGRLDAQSLKVFPFGGVKCARTTRAVIAHFSVD